MKALLVGQAPGPSGAGARRAFDGDSGARLEKHAGYPVLRMVDTVNLLPWWPGKASNKGCAFPEHLARQSARALDLQGRRVVLLAGRKVARAFDVEFEYLQWRGVEGARWAVLPHPSGVNMWWNSAANRRAFAEFALELIRLL